MSSLMRNGLMRDGLISNNLDFPEIRRLGADDLKKCAALAVDRGWWPERDKWSLLLDASEGYAIDAPDGLGLAGTVVLTRWGASCAAIGMMLVASRYEGHGLGRALMEHALGAAGEGTAVSLYATAAGRPLYEKLGFKPVRRSVAFRGRFRVGPQPDNTRKGKAPAEASGSSGNVRIATEADLPGILALDGAAYGADRERILARLPAFAERIVVFEASEGITGWAIEDGVDDNAEAINLYEKLEKAVVPLYLKAPEAWGKLMRTTIAYNGSFFNTNRMVKQYIRNAYYPVSLMQHAAVEEPVPVGR